MVALHLHVVSVFGKNLMRFAFFWDISVRFRGFQTPLMPPLVWGDKNNDTLMGQLQLLQNKAAKVLLNLPPRSSSTEALDCLDLKTLLKKRHFRRCVLMQKYLKGILILNLMSNAIVVFILILLAKAMIYTFHPCVPTGASKLSFTKHLRIRTS